MVIGLLCAVAATVLNTIAGLLESRAARTSSLVLDDPIRLGYRADGGRPGLPDDGDGAARRAAASPG